MSSRFISQDECGEEYEVEVIFYDEETGKFETESGFEIDEDDIDNIGREVLEEFINSGDAYAWIRSDYLELDYEVVRQ